MGIFSSKKKTYVGISNSRLYEGQEIPNSIKDSTAGYISDVGQGLNGNNYIVDYNNLAMESAIPIGMKRAFNYVNKKDINNYNKFSSTEKDLKEPNNIDSEVQRILITNLNKYYTDPVINYYNYDYLDISHLIKFIMNNEYKWNSYNNYMFFNGLSGWLYSIDIHLKEEQNEPRLGNSFASGETATRAKDTSRPFRPFIYNSEDRNKFVIKFMPKYIKNYTQVTKILTDKTTEEVLDTQEEIIFINDNQPTEESSTNYNTTSDIIEELIYENPDDSNITIKEIKKEFIELSYGTLKQKTIYLDTYLGIPPDDLPVIDGESSSPTNQRLKDYISQIEGGINSHVDNDSNIYISVSINEDGDTNQHFIFTNNINDEVSGLYLDIAEDLNKLINISQTYGYVPNVHLKKKNEVVSKKDIDWEINNGYAKRLGIKLNGLYEKLTQSMENDRDKIRHAYITFGVNVHASSELVSEYMYNYFDNELNGLSTVSEKEIKLKTNSTLEKFGWDSITKTIVNTAIDFDYINDSSDGQLVILKKINGVQHERIEVKDYHRRCEVSSGKWGSTSEDSDLLLPLNLDVVKTYIKGFIKKERLLYISMYVEFLTYVVVKKKWYQRGAFKLVTIVAGAAIVFVTGGAGSYLSALLISTATTYAIDFAVKLTVKTLGAKWAKILAYGLAIVGLGKGIGGAMIATGQNITKVLGAFLSNAKLFVSIANKMLNQSIQTVGVERQEEMDENNRELARLKEMTENLLGSRVNEVEYQTDRNYMSSYIYLGTMESYLDEILDLNKIDSCIEYIHNYSEYLISLPRLEDSVGSILGVK